MTNRAPLLFCNGRIYADAYDASPATALLVRGPHVAALGSEGELRALVDGGAPTVVDLDGGTAVPGLVDAHGHFVGYGERLENADLVGCRSYEEVIARLVDHARGMEPGTWILGRGWDHTRWPDGDFPHHAPLSEALPDHPVYVRRIDGHAGLANARALEMAGLRKPVDPRVEGGEIHVGDDGLPTGVLVDYAMDLVAEHVPAPDRRVIERRILAAQDALLAVGLVGVHDMGSSAEELEVLEDLDCTGRLKIRVVSYLWANEGVPAALAARYRRPDRDAGSARLRVVGAKLMMDGALGSRGAALLEDYDDRKGERGLLMMEPAQLDELIDAAAEAGLQPATHAIGDRANRAVLDAYARRLARDPGFRALRPRVEHAQIVAEADWDRFVAQGVIPSMQPTHATTDMRWAPRLLGEARLTGAYAWRRLPGDGAPLALGSDFPIEDPDPRRGLHAARTRQDEAGLPPGGWHSDQCLDARDALHGFTSGAAFAAHEEEARGQLHPGFHADMTVFDVDPLTCGAGDLLRASVLLTVVDGEVVHRQDAR